MTWAMAPDMDTLIHTTEALTRHAPVLHVRSMLTNARAWATVGLLAYSGRYPGADRGACMDDMWMDSRGSLCAADGRLILQRLTWDSSDEGAHSCSITKEVPDVTM